MTSVECKRLLDFLYTSKSTLHIWCKKFGFCCKRRSKKMQIYQELYADLVPPACNFVKCRTTVQVLSMFFNNSTKGVILQILTFFSTCNFIKIETLTQVFSCESFNIFKSTYFAEYLRRASSNDMIIARYF